MNFNFFVTCLRKANVQIKMKYNLKLTWTRAVDFPQNVGHPSFVSNKSCRMDRLRAIILWKSLAFTTMAPAALLRKESLRSVSRRRKFSMRLKRELICWTISWIKEKNDWINATGQSTDMKRDSEAFNWCVNFSVLPSSDVREKGTGNRCQN